MSETSAGDGMTWKCWHRWAKWEVKNRQMVLVAGLLTREADRGKEYTEEYQERRCEKCGLTKRRNVEIP